jgi:uroporphyrinogen decarboxylase
MKNDLIIRAAKGEKVERVPVWIMRQAGRYLPGKYLSFLQIFQLTLSHLFVPKEFREIRTKHSFFDLVQNPQLACDVTLMVIEIFIKLNRFYANFLFVFSRFIDSI